MSLTAKQRRELLAASHPLKPLVTISPDNLSDDVVAQVRAAFTGRTLLKVRVNADHAAACDAVAADLAARVPCDLVKRVGHVLILHRPPDATEAVEVQ
jgi:putative YhbY family RNA-binding protein